MKRMKKLASLLLALVMTMAMAMPAFAAGSNSITVVNAKDGETYNIYRLLDLSVDNEGSPSSYRYTLNDKWRAFWTTGDGKDYIDTNTAGSNIYVVWKDSMKSAEQMEAFAKAASQYASDNSISADYTAVNAASGIAKWESIDNGYYLVTSTYGIAASVASTPTYPAQTIEEKNNENTVEKKVQENVERNGAAASWEALNDAQIGDTITFRSKVSIAKNSVKVVYHDTMDSGFTFSGVDSVKVCTDEVCTTELGVGNYTVELGSGGETFTVTFTDTYVAGLTDPSTDLYVKYTAVLNDDVTDAGVKNTGIVKWGDAGASATSSTTTYTRKFEILKYDTTDTAKNPLAGAEFKLYTSETGGTALKLAKNAAGTVYRVVDTSDRGASLPSGYTLVDNDTIVTLASDKIIIEGVDSDNYWLEETKAPTGYTRLSGRVTVGVLASNGYLAEIKNKSGTVLPSTGGIGTTIFYIIGSILVVGAGVLLIVRRRMSSDRD